MNSKYDNYISTRKEYQSINRNYIKDRNSQVESTISEMENSLEQLNTWYEMKKKESENLEITQLKNIWSEEQKKNKRKINRTSGAYGTSSVIPK